MSLTSSSRTSCSATVVAPISSTTNDHFRRRRAHPGHADMITDTITNMMTYMVTDVITDMMTTPIRLRTSLMGGRYGRPLFSFAVAVTSSGRRFPLVGAFRPDHHAR